MRITKEAIIISVIAVIFVVGMGFLIMNSQKFVQPAGLLNVSDSTLLVKDTSAMTGKKDAKVTMVEFGDYQCPACATAHPLVKQVTDAYASNPDFNFVFRNFPLPQHPNARISAEAAEAAGAQGKYWQMHDALYEHQAEWVDVASPLPVFVKYATSMGLDVEKFTADVSANKFANLISADENDANRIGINQTPTIFINGKQQATFSVSALKSAIDEALK